MPRLTGYRRRPMSYYQFRAVQRRVGTKRKAIIPVGFNPNVYKRRRITAFRNRRTGGFVGREMKFVDYEVTATALVAGVAGGEKNPANGCLNGVTIGDGESERDGRKYTMHSVHVRGFFQQPGTSTKGGTATVRIAIVIDTQTNKGSMSAEDCFLDVTDSQSTDAFRNLQNSGRFVVLKDKTYVLNRIANLGNGTANDSSEVQRKFSFNIKIPDKWKIVNTGGTTNNVNVITTNSIHLLSWCNDVTDAPNIRYNSRVRFTG